MPSSHFRDLVAALRRGDFARAQQHLRNRGESALLAVRSSDGLPVLHALVAEHSAGAGVSLGALAWLLAHGADPNQPDSTSLRRTALHHCHDAQAVRLLLRHGADPGLRDAQGEHAFASLAATGDVPLVEDGIARYRPSPAALGSALRAAAWHGSTPAVRLLIARGAPVNNRPGKTRGRASRAPSARSGATPLMLALNAGHVPAAECLLDAGALAEQAINRTTAMAWTLPAPDPRPGIDLLIARGFHPDSCTRARVTALSLACGSADLGAVRHLIARGADPNLADTRHLRTPLHVASAHAHATLVHVLLEAGADPAREDAEGMTPRAIAAQAYATVSAIPTSAHTPASRFAAVLEVFDAHTRARTLRSRIESEDVPRPPSQDPDSSL